MEAEESLVFDEVVAWYHARPSEYLTAEKGSSERSQQLRALLGDWTRTVGSWAAVFDALVRYSLRNAPSDECRRGARLTKARAERRATQSDGQFWRSRQSAHRRPARSLCPPLSWGVV